MFVIIHSFFTNIQFHKYHLVFCTNTKFWIIFLQIPLIYIFHLVKIFKYIITIPVPPTINQTELGYFVPSFVSNINFQQAQRVKRLIFQTSSQFLGSQYISYFSQLSIITFVYMNILHQKQQLYLRSNFCHIKAPKFKLNYIIYVANSSCINWVFFAQKKKEYSKISFLMFKKKQQIAKTLCQDFIFEKCPQILITQIQQMFQGIQNSKVLLYWSLQFNFRFSLLHQNIMLVIEEFHLYEILTNSIKSYYKKILLNIFNLINCFWNIIKIFFQYSELNLIFYLHHHSFCCQFKFKKTTIQFSFFRVIN
ncbi:unnamed protein product [Paramecium sonneborni]|uniref:Transmembrane protein n=1 Tax=Paramecium sonneborni TaxID=65129 RepID=A0A8S1R1U6_9CILI|nr:unnamed protein product [Paramecium sonneborni]